MNNFIDQKSKIIDLEGIGPVLFEKSKKAKRLNISVRANRGVRVAVPTSLSFKKAKEYVEPRRDWIIKHQSRLAKLELKHQTYLSNLPSLDRKEGRIILVSRLDELAREHGFSYNKVFIRCQKTRWGSCSSKNNINLNIKLTRLPDELRDYVLLHELVHTRIKNHGKLFWAAMENLVEDVKSVDSRLKEYDLGLL